jgi:hypothetical protein
MLLVSVAFVLQGTALAIDEFYFHHARGLGRWERIGHPIDTLFYCLALATVVLSPPTMINFMIFVGLSAISCLLITKDGFIRSYSSFTPAH